MLKDRKVALTIFTGIVIVSIIFSWLEYLNPYYFVQDDNFAQFLPVMIHAMEQLFTGHFPAINFHQFMGSPIYETGTYAVFYPVTVISYFVSHFILKNDFLMFEIFAFIHLVIGFVFTFLLINKETGKKLISLLGSLAFIFSGYVLITSNSWYYVLPSIIFIPLIFFMHSYLAKSNSLKVIFFLGFLRAIYFFGGNAQYFIYTCLFELVFVLISKNHKKTEPFHKYFEKYMLSLVLTFALILPLLLPQLFYSTTTSRLDRGIISYVFSPGISLKDLFLGGILQYPLVKSANYVGYAQEAFIQSYHWNTLFFLIFIIGAFYSIYSKIKNKEKKLSPYLFLSLIALMLGLGSYGLIYIVGGLMPIIKNFSVPWKFLIYLAFFSIIFSSNLLSYLQDKYKKLAKQGLFLFTLLFFVIFILHVNTTSKVSLSYYGDDLPLNLSKFDGLNINDGRIITIVSEGKFDPFTIKNKTLSQQIIYSQFMAQNFATYYSLNHIAGYEPFISSRTSNKIPVDRFGLRNPALNITTMREYGIKYIFTPTENLDSFKELNIFEIRYQNENFTILDIGEVKTLVFAEDPLNYSQKGSKINFYTNFSKKTEVTINFIRLEGYKAYYNGESIALQEDNLGRIVLNIPSGKGEVIVKYTIPLIWVGEILALFIILLLLIYLLKFRQKTIIFISKIKIRGLSSRIKLFIVALITLSFIFLCMAQFNSTLVESTLKERINLDSKIEELRFSPTNRALFINNISFSNAEKDTFRADEIKLNISLKDTLNSKGKNLVFAEVLIINPIFNINLTRKNDECEKKLIIYSDKDFYQIYGGATILKSVVFTPLNKANVIFKNNSLNTKSGEVFIYGEVNIDKFISGKITLSSGNETTYKSERCISLPFSEKNLLFRG